MATMAGGGADGVFGIEWERAGVVVSVVFDKSGSSQELEWWALSASGTTTVGKSGERDERARHLTSFQSGPECEVQVQVQVRVKVNVEAHLHTGRPARCLRHQTVSTLYSAHIRYT